MDMEGDIGADADPMDIESTHEGVSIDDLPTELLLKVP